MATAAQIYEHWLESQSLRKTGAHFGVSHIKVRNTIRKFYGYQATSPEYTSLYRTLVQDYPKLRHIIDSTIPKVDSVPMRYSPANTRSLGWVPFNESIEVPLPEQDATLEPKWVLWLIDQIVAILND